MSGWVVVLTGPGMSPLRAEIFGGWHAWVIHMRPLSRHDQFAAKVEATSALNGWQMDDWYDTRTGTLR
ncbi:hypothetical protein B5M44_23720 [Shinella sumterensis]|nr:hypothetical protein B5M44_23720 [Shinella sumterensis]